MFGVSPWRYANRTFCRICELPNGSLGASKPLLCKTQILQVGLQRLEVLQEEDWRARCFKAPCWRFMPHPADRKGLAAARHTYTIKLLAQHFQLFH